MHNGEEIGRRIGITGASGLVGSALSGLLTTAGYQVVRLVRSGSVPDDPGMAHWDPAKGVLEPSKLEGLDALVHLAGDNIAGGRWTARKKTRIRDSRVLGTQALVRSLGELSRPPELFVAASAIGYYGDRGDELLTEESSAGDGFLAEVCQEWELAASVASSWAIRVASTRFGMILSPQGGALAKMLPAFRLGGGGRIGDGQQFMSWISIDDAASALIHLLVTPDLSGPVNLVAPNPVRNREFTRDLANALRRPAVVPMPAGLARLLFGEMADELLLGSTRVAPTKLLSSGYSFSHADLPTALSALLGRK